MNVKFTLKIVRSPKHAGLLTFTKECKLDFTPMRGMHLSPFDTGVGVSINYVQIFINEKNIIDGHSLAIIFLEDIDWSQKPASTFNWEDQLAAFKKEGWKSDYFSDED